MNCTMSTGVLTGGRTEGENWSGGGRQPAGSGMGQII